MYEPMTTEIVEDGLLASQIADNAPLEDIDLRIPRWIVYAGQDLTTDFRRKMKGMELGGTYMGSDYKTLAPTKHMLRRCQLTPMVLGYDYVNSDTLGNDLSKAKIREVSALSHDDVNNPMARKLFRSYGFECLPGNELAGIQTAQQGNGDQGIREVRVLRGIEPQKRLDDGAMTQSIATECQTAIFPDWHKYLKGTEPFFATTGDLHNYLVKRKGELQGQLAGEVIDTFIESNQQFEQWATRNLDSMSRLVKAPPTEGGRVYSWEAIHLEFFDILGLNKEEFLQKKSDSRQGTNEVSTSEFAEFRQQFLATQQQNTEILKLLAANQIQVPVVPAVPEVIVVSAPKLVDETKICGATTASGAKCGTMTGGSRCRHHPE